MAFGSNVLPGGGNVIQGQASVFQSGSRMQVSQTSKNAVLNWSAFSIGKGASVHFDNANGATLNRVTGNLPSTIDGSLSATGSLYLINRNGVIVGREGVINAAGFMATTLDVRDDEFMAGGSLRFLGDSRAGIVNLGSIRADSGNVALVAHSVRNEGSISAPMGSTDLLAGQEIFFASPDAPALLVRLGEDGTDNGNTTGVANTGLIEAAQARLQAANGNLYGLAINQSGVIRATGVSNKDGRIVLTADGGTVRQDGVLTAQNGDGSGGEILVGGDYQGRNAAVANAARTEITAHAQMDASAAAAQGDGGRIIVWADEHTTFAGRIAARGGAEGGDGGFAEVSGKRTLDFRPDAPIDLSAPKGKTGTVLLDPDEIAVVDTVAGANQISSATVEAGLASASYILDTSNFDPELGSGNIDVDSDIRWSNANTLTLKSGNAIRIDANITAPLGALEMYAGRHAEAPMESGLLDVYGGARLTAGHTLHVNRLRYGANADSLPAGYTANPEPRTGSFEADGDLRVNTLELELSGGQTGLFTGGAANTIAAFRTVGSGSMGWVDITNHGSDLNLFLQSAEATWLQIVTPGKLTLEAGSQLTSTWGDIVLASTAGNFVNQAGSDALRFTQPGARFLIYTGSQAGTVTGGLAGTNEFSRSFAANPPSDYTDGVSRFLFRDAASSGSQQLTYRADDLSRFYGDANPGFTYTVGGLQNGDILSDVVTGAPLLYSTATLQSGVGQYAIHIGQGTLASSSYTFLFSPGTLTVNAAPVTIDIASVSRYYGDVNPAFDATASGLKNGDSLADALAGWSLVSSATRASGVGSYAIAGDRNSGNPNANYVLAFNPGTLTIHPTPVTLTLDPASMVYGNVLPNFNALATLTGAYNGDTLATAFPGASFSTAATSASSVGSYAVNAASGFSNPNYVLTIGSLGALSITKAPLLIHAGNASRIYGDANPVFSVASVTGWRNGDTLASIPGLQLVSSATATSNVGAYAIVPAGSATNYEFVAGSGLLAVQKAPVDVYLNAASRYYGDADPTFTVTYQGLKNGEAALPGLQPVSHTDQYTPVGNYAVTAGGATTFQNYLPTFYAGVLTVAPRPLTVTANHASRVYGADNPTLTTSVSGATSWDAAQAASFWMGETTATPRSDTGNYAIAVTTSPYSGAGFSNLGNYAVTFNPGTLSVTRAPVQITAVPVSMVWGDERPPLTYQITGALMPWDSVDVVDSEGKAQLTSLAGGTQVAPGQYAITVANGALGRNYQAVITGAPMVEVLRRPIVIVGNYAAPLAQIQQIHAGQMESFTVISYDSDGRAWLSSAAAPLAGGPQFSVLASSDGTRGSGLGTYVGKAFIEPAEGTSLADVFRYYDVTSRPGTAQSDLNTGTLINRDWTPSAPQAIVVDQSGTPITVQPPPEPPPPGVAPTMGFLVDDAFPDNRTLIDEIQSLLDRAGQSGPDADAAKKLVDAMPESVRVYLNAAMKNENGNDWYRQTIAETEAWLANLANTRPRPENYDALVAKAEADIAQWRETMNAQPSMDGLRQMLAAGDKDTVQALMPLITGKLVRDAQSGTLSPQVQGALVRLINEQRANTIAKADAKYEAHMEASAARGLANVVSAPKLPDLIGGAYVEVTGEQMKQAELLGGGVAAVVGSGVAIAGATLGVAAMIGVGGKAISLFAAVGVGLASGATYTAGAGGLAAAAGPAIAAAVAIAIGTAEVVQIVETTKNYDRYIAYKAANQPLDSLQGLNMDNPDNAMQLIAAIGALAVESLGSQGTAP